MINRALQASLDRRRRSSPSIWTSKSRAIILYMIHSFNPIRKLPQINFLVRQLSTDTEKLIIWPHPSLTINTCKRSKVIIISIHSTRSKKMASSRSRDLGPLTLKCNKWLKMAPAHLEHHPRDLAQPLPICPPHYLALQGNPEKVQIMPVFRLRATTHSVNPTSILPIQLIKASSPTHPWHLLMTSRAPWNLMSPPIKE